MKPKVHKIFTLACFIFVVCLTIALLCCNRYSAIDQWSSQLVPEKITLAELSKEYGVEKLSYTVQKQSYNELIEILNTITERNCSRKEKAQSLEDGYRLAIFYEGKLWLFKCCENQIVSLTFADHETGAYYGCEGKQLYINNPVLWNYIKNTIDEKANE